MKRYIIASLILVSACTKIEQMRKPGKERDTKSSAHANKPKQVVPPNETEGVGQGNGIRFNLGDAFAVGLITGAEEQNAQDEDAQSNLLAFNPNGSTALASNGRFSKLYPLVNGFLARESSQLGAWHIVSSDGNDLLFSGPQNDWEVFAGEMPNGDLVFSDATIFRLEAKKHEKIRTTLTDPRVERVSGYFILLRGDELTQIYDLRTEKRYPVDPCNRQAMIAISTTKALVDQCNGSNLIDMTNGSWSNVANIDLQNEFLMTPDGIVLLSARCGTPDFDIGGAKLCHVSRDGVVSVISTETFKPHDGGSISGEAESNSSLFSSENWLVIRELSEIKVFNRDDGIVRSVLDDVSVFSVRVSQHQIYFAGEDWSGNPIFGLLDLNVDQASPQKYPLAHTVEHLVPLK